MKRIAPLLLSAIMIFSFSACKGEKAEETTTKPQTTTEEKSTESSNKDTGTTESVSQKETAASSKENKTTKAAEKVTTTTTKSISTTAKPTTTTTTVTTTTVADICKLEYDLPRDFRSGSSQIYVVTIVPKFEANPNNPNQVRIKFSIYANIESVENEFYAVDLSITNSLGEEVFKRDKYFSTGDVTKSYRDANNEVTDYVNVGNGTFTLHLTESS